jgi:hypothetical protein
MGFAGSNSVDGESFWSLYPDPVRARAATREIDRRLIASLRYVFDTVGESLGCDADRVAHWLDGLAAADRPDPLVHALFHSLVAEYEGGDFDAARRLADRLLTVGAGHPGLEVHPVEPDESSRRPVGLFSRFADLEEANSLDFVVPTEATVARVTPFIAEALGLISRNDPGLDGEFRALVSDILLVAQAPGHKFTTWAVSCFQNWGGLLVNAAVQEDALDLVEMFAHEATHLLLFATALDEPLVTNPPDELHHSPIRGAPRSMDGVFHATIVSARVIRAMLQQASAAGQDSELAHLAHAHAAPHLRLFDEGVEIVEAAARLTPLGRRVLDDGKAFVADARSELLTSA